MAGYFAGHQVICQRLAWVVTDGVPEGPVDVMALAGAQCSALYGIAGMWVSAGAEL